MKQRFEGEIHENIPKNWDNYVIDNKYMNKKYLEILKKSNDTPFICVTNEKYNCLEYKMKLNIFSYSHFKLFIQFNVVGLPISVSKCGFCGDIETLILDYKKRKGLFLILNMDYAIKDTSVAIGETLSTCIFYNIYHSFDEYLSELRSPYRRRVNKALLKGKDLIVEKIKNQDFDNSVYQLYLNVLKKSKYPLETLGIDFFRETDGDINVFYKDKKAVAFIFTSIVDSNMNFILGGMDYKERDEFDLYYNMLIKIIKLGIENKVSQIDFGQTAESSKERIGCVIMPKYMCAFSGNKLINKILIKFSSLLEYKRSGNIYHSFKTNKTN